VRKKVKARRIVRAEPSGVRAELSLDELWDLQLAASNQFADDAERRANYWRHRERLIRAINLGFRPDAFWCYEPDVPDDCRPDAYDALVEQYDPALHGDPGGSAFPEHYWADEQLMARRRAWLLGPGKHHLREGERAEFARQMAAAERA
jgi:hypothetical protein